MSKNLKCPVCQKGTIMFKENLSCECSQCRFQCHHGQIERIAAAMSEIQPCPICGKHPMFPPTYDPCEPSPEAVECCGFVAYTAELWNKYAAAMTLAKLTVKMKTCRAYCPEMAFLHAQDCVMEVFK